MESQSSSGETSSTPPLHAPTGSNNLYLTATGVPSRESSPYFRARRDAWFARERRKIQPIRLAPSPPIVIPVQIPFTQIALKSSSQQSTITTVAEGLLEASEFTVKETPLALDETATKAAAIDAPTQQYASTTPAFSPAPALFPATTDYRKRLIDFYTKFNSSKLDNIDKTLASYLGREEELFAKLHARYESNIPLPPLADDCQGTLCYLEIAKYGRITIQLFQNTCPLACENFRALCTGEKGVGRSKKPLHYRNTYVHRVVPNFCIQAGDFTKADGTGGESIFAPNLPQKTDLWGNFVDEAFLQHSQVGLVSMANNGTNRNSSQFFITLKAPLKQLDGKHVVFGRVVSGIQVVQQIGMVPTDEKQRPKEQIIIQDCGQVTVTTSHESSSDAAATQEEVSRVASFQTATQSSTTIFGVPLAASTTPLSFGSWSGQSQTPFGQSSISKSPPTAIMQTAHYIQIDSSLERATIPSASVFGAAAATAMTKPLSFASCGGQVQSSFNQLSTGTFGPAPTASAAQASFGGRAFDNKTSYFGGALSNSTSTPALSSKDLFGVPQQISGTSTIFGVESAPNMVMKPSTLYRDSRCNLDDDDDSKLADSTSTGSSDDSTCRQSIDQEMPELTQTTGFDITIPVTGNNFQSTSFTLPDASVLIENFGSAQTVFPLTFPVAETPTPTSFEKTQQRETALKVDGTSNASIKAFEVAQDDKDGGGDKGSIHAPVSDDASAIASDGVELSEQQGVDEEAEHTKKCLSDDYVMINHHHKQVVLSTCISAANDVLIDLESEGDAIARAGNEVEKEGVSLDSEAFGQRSTGYQHGIDAVPIDETGYRVADHCMRPNCILTTVTFNERLVVKNDSSVAIATTVTGGATPPSIFNSKCRENGNLASSPSQAARAIPAAYAMNTTQTAATSGWPIPVSRPKSLARPIFAASIVPPVTKKVTENSLTSLNFALERSLLRNPDESDEMQKQPIDKTQGFKFGFPSLQGTGKKFDAHSTEPLFLSGDEFEEEILDDEAHASESTRFQRRLSLVEVHLAEQILLYFPQRVAFKSTRPPEMPCHSTSRCILLPESNVSRVTHVYADPLLLLLGGASLEAQANDGKSRVLDAAPFPFPNKHLVDLVDDIDEIIVCGFSCANMHPLDSLSVDYKSEINAVGHPLVHEQAKELTDRYSASATINESLTPTNEAAVATMHEMEMVSLLGYQLIEKELRTNLMSHLLVQLSNINSSTRARSLPNQHFSSEPIHEHNSATDPLQLSFIDWDDGKHSVVLSLQRCVRRALARKRFAHVRQQAKAALVQRVARGYLARLKIKKRRPSHGKYSAQRDTATICLQSSFRAFMTRRRYQSLRANRKFIAAVLVQSKVRAFLARTHLHQAHQAIVIIQKTVRGYTTKKAFLVALHKRREDLQNAAAMSIQRSCRGFIARRDFHRRQQFVDALAVRRHSAAVRIQSMNRARKIATDDSATQRASATVRIQNVARKFLARKAYTAELIWVTYATTMLQTSWRGFQARQRSGLALRALKRKMIVNDAAVRIQSAWLIFLARKAHLLRLHEAQRNLRKRNNAILAIQDYLRSYRARRVIVSSRPQTHCRNKRMLLSTLQRTPPSSPTNASTGAFTDRTSIISSTPWSSTTNTPSPFLATQGSAEIDAKHAIQFPLCENDDDWETLPAKTVKDAPAHEIESRGKSAGTQHASTPLKDDKMVDDGDECDTKLVFGSCAGMNDTFKSVAAKSPTKGDALGGTMNHPLASLSLSQENTDAAQLVTNETSTRPEVKPIYFGSAGKSPHAIYFGNAASEYRRNMFEAGIAFNPNGPTLQSSAPNYSQFRFRRSKPNSDSESESSATSIEGDDVPRHFNLLGRQQPAVPLTTRSLDSAGRDQVFRFGTDEGSTVSDGLPR
ncbi:hypothetical protein MPSEU_001071200 [Mayamaea pseudoterrestris]|nr:hypothetical protein MPSEU_001071200 [Mayamaea pseudoterrestris]